MNHLEGHLLAAFLSEEAPAFPYLGLVVSGGHTSLYVAEASATTGCSARPATTPPARPSTRGPSCSACPTRAAWPSTGWPGTAIARAVKFPRAIVKGGPLDFSFSGLKTALLHHVRKHGVPEGQALADLCASYQEAIVGALVAKALPRRARARSSTGWCSPAAWPPTAGCAPRWPERAAEYEGMRVFLPPPRHCTDNAAMIAVAGTQALLRGERAGPDAERRPGLAAR